MKTTAKLTIVLVALFTFISCNNDDDSVAEFTVTAIAPESGTVGAEITITGTNFPSEATSVNLTFDGVNATINSLSSTQIVAAVPAGATSGEVSIMANGITKAATASFTVLSDLVSGTIENLFAPQTGGQGQGEISGDFTKFSFASGEVTTSDTEWDIAFRGTTIAVNGGEVTGTNDEPERNGNAAVAVVDGIFSEVNSIDGLSFVQDVDAAFAIPTGSDNGWYNYNFMTNLVTPIPGKVLVFKTSDGRYAKVEILSYYENAPASPDGFVDASRYYTFNYVYNPNDGQSGL